MKNLYIFNDHNNYFSKVNYQFGIVNGNTAIWEKNSASKNEKIIFQAKDTVNCTITKISIINEAGETHTITNFEETYTPQSLSAPRRAVAAAAVIESEQLLSATNETAGVQTQALENTIDASEVSDSDWASGLLLAGQRDESSGYRQQRQHLLLLGGGRTCHGLYAKLSVPGC